LKELVENDQSKKDLALQNLGTFRTLICSPKLTIDKSLYFNQRTKGSILSPATPIDLCSPTSANTVHRRKSFNRRRTGLKINMQQTFDFTNLQFLMMFRKFVFTKNQEFCKNYIVSNMKNNHMIGHLKKMSKDV